MSHLLGDRGHRKIVFAGEVGQQEELWEREVTAVQFAGEVEDTRSLSEENKIRKAVMVHLTGG